jgi:hypothetical protein
VIFRAWPIALVLALAACETSGSATSGQVSTTFDGNKKLVLAAGYTANAQSNGISVWADVPAGTLGMVETTGPLHMRCEGKFVAQNDNQANPDNLPVLDLGGGAGIAFAAPIGHYVAVATLPSMGARIQKSFEAGSSYADPITGVYDLSLGCVPVADSVQQLDVLRQQHSMAVQAWITRITDKANNAQLQPLADREVQAVQSGDTAAALKLMTQIKGIVEPLATQNPYYDIFRDALASIALLTQAPPAS